ncbi:hypothetical protein GT347_13265 [Xylophilus rhododendri]|uniref:RES domain-containing protein n=1 Tax=Xylophilus rhododendri TaxID=2697032 RepID=A0A857J7W5_9BURK|nr:hypothetical protein [Xylophilus rhododendri]QHI98875.1 hypothetical protein GT347_13265 [Xylophilus rhododendri]
MEHAGAEPATYDGLFHRAGERVVYAWSRPELAAMCSAFLSAGIEPEEMLWEKLTLPANGVILDLGSNETVSPDLLARLREHKYLGAWVPTSITPEGMALIMDPAHANFTEISVKVKHFLKHPSRG